MSASYICTVLLACFGFSLANLCGSDTYGDVDSAGVFAVPLQPIYHNYLNYYIQIPALEACQSVSPYAQPVGTRTVVCSQLPPPPSVSAQSLYQTAVKATSETVASVVVYCLPLYGRSQLEEGSDVNRHAVGLPHIRANVM